MTRGTRTPGQVRVPYGYRIEHGPIVAGEGFWIAKANPCPQGGDGKANAEFLVRAWNTHDELVAALRRIESHARAVCDITHAECIGHDVPVLSSRLDQLFTAADEARAAIAKAEVTP